MSRSANELIDRHNITQCDTDFQIPPSIRQLRGARGEALLFTQQQHPTRTDLNGGGGAAGGSDSTRQPLLMTAGDGSLQPAQPAAAAAAGVKMTAAGGSGGGGDKSKRKQIMTRARKHPTVDRIITVLQDKRVDDDQADQIQDLQLPMLRKVLNVIFIALGVVFLLGVIVVIIYTSLGKDEYNRKH